MTKKLHPRNIHNKSYDLKALVISYPKLSAFVKENQYGELSVNFSDSKAVLCLNQALMAHHYDFENWTVPEGNLIPPIPGRVDYLHYMADLLSEDNGGVLPVGPKNKVLDIGTGASCIYPILGNSIYGWKFVATDINSDSINHSNTLIKANTKLKKNIKNRFQKDANSVFRGMIKSDEKFVFSMCNPPFYASKEEAQEKRNQKLNNLNRNREKKGHSPSAKNNFAGLNNELWCEGGELAFLKNMIIESVEFKNQCGWFSSLVSNKSNFEELNNTLDEQKVRESRVIEMIHGNKIVHILAWRF